MRDKAIFLDRDNTLIEDPGYISSPDQVKLLDGVGEALIELKAMGYRLIVVTNQSAVARGIVTEKVLSEIHKRLKELLVEKGVYLDGIYYCPYHPDGAIAKYRKESDLRKPNPGMLLAAADEMDIDLSQSWMIGNNGSDIEAGLRAGCKTVLVESSLHTKQVYTDAPSPDYKSINMKETVNIIKKYHRSSGEPATQTQSATIPGPQPSVQTTRKPRTLSRTSAEVDTADETTEQLLSSILGQLKSMRRSDMFGEFSLTRLLAGIVQIVVLFCLLISLWFLMRAGKEGDSVLIALGFAMVFQVMSLTLYTMQRRR